MATLATWTIQAALVTLLKADAVLAGLSLTAGTDTVRIYDDVPNNALYPHVIVGAGVITTPAHTFGGPSVGIGWRDIFRIHAMSRYEGKKEAQLIMARIVALLNFQPLAVEGFPQVTMECERVLTLIREIEKISTRDVVADICVQVHQ